MKVELNTSRKIKVGDVITTIADDYLIVDAEGLNATIFVISLTSSKSITKFKSIEDLNETLKWDILRVIPSKRLILKEISE